MTTLNAISVAVFLVFSVIDVSLGYSKYGRTCGDIGCMSNEVCVMAEDPCHRGSTQCGSYPTCERKSHSVSTCTTFVCPPTTHCRMDGDTPKCISDNGPLGNNANPYENVDLHNTANNNNNNGGTADHKPAAPIYPQVPPRGQTTTRAPIYRPANGANNYGGGGYQGGSVGSGYPGQGGGQPQYPSGYPGNYGSGYSGGSIGGGYPGGYSGYPGQNTNNYYNNRNPTNQGGYSGYPNYPYQGGSTSNQNPNNNANRYGTTNSNSGSNPLYDKLTDTLKNLGLFCIVLVLQRANNFQHP